ncbi:hypothetical protein ACJJIL_18970 [Microbulbifer sp. EKSA005]|uniref:hypothetical protein n=1 Tax=Microbulbifer sp. EKSA005 TaxID=3243364 RepID=UPI004042CF38
MTFNFRKSLRETIANSDLPKAIESIGEVSIDSLMDSGVTKDIPILSTLLNIGKGITTVKNYLFAKKMIAFLKEISYLSESERNSLVEKLDNDSEFLEKTGERLIEALSNMDGEYKPKLLGIALRLYAHGEISAPDFERINYSLQRFLMCDINHLPDFCAMETGRARPTDDDPVTSNLINAGLAYVSSGFGGGGVHPTKVAHLLLKVAKESNIEQLQT